MSESEPAGAGETEEVGVIGAGEDNTHSGMAE